MLWRIVWAAKGEPVVEKPPPAEPEAARSSREVIAPSLSAGRSVNARGGLTTQAVWLRIEPSPLLDLTTPRVSGAK